VKCPTVRGQRYRPGSKKKKKASCARKRPQKNKEKKTNKGFEKHKKVLGRRSKGAGEGKKIRTKRKKRTRTMGEGGLTAGLISDKFKIKSVEAE